MTNRIVNKISRISKYLILIFDNHKYCIIHLGMSGTVHLINKNQETERKNQEHNGEIKETNMEKRGWNKTKWKNNSSFGYSSQ